MERIDAGNELMLEGRALRDRLAEDGSNPVLLLKLESLVDLPYLNPAQALQLRNLIALAAVRSAP